MADEMKELAELAQQVAHINQTNDERHKQQMDYNNSVSETLKEIGNAINRIDIFQAELNHTNSIVDDTRTKTEENSKEIIAIGKTLAADRSIIDELRQWRLYIAAAMVTLVVGAIGTALTPDKEVEAVNELNETMEKLVIQMLEEREEEKGKD